MKIRTQGKDIGELDRERKVFKKRVSKRKHLFRKLDAWGIDAKFFTEKLLPKDMWVQVEDMDPNGKIYLAKASKIKELGSFLHFPGHGAQVFLPRSEWRVC